MEIFAERSELVAQYPNLVIDQHLLIRYPSAEFFFVSPESPAGQGDPRPLEAGLRRRQLHEVLPRESQDPRGPGQRQPGAEGHISLPNPGHDPLLEHTGPIGNIPRRDEDAATSTGVAQAARQGGAMKRLDEWFSDYGQSHRHPVNVAIHQGGGARHLPLRPGPALVPAGRALPPSLNWAALVSPCRCWPSICSRRFPLFVGMAALTALGLALCYTWQGPLLWPALAGFVLLWLAQFVGHRIEGNAPPSSPTCNFCW